MWQDVAGCGGIKYLEIFNLSLIAANKIAPTRRTEHGN